MLHYIKLLPSHFHYSSQNISIRYTHKHKINLPTLIKLTMDAINDNLRYMERLGNLPIQSRRVFKKYRVNSLHMQIYDGWKYLRYLHASSIEKHPDIANGKVPPWYTSWSFAISLDISEEDYTSLTGEITDLITCTTYTWRLDVAQPDDFN